MTVHSTLTLQPFPVRLLPAFATVYGFDTCVSDVRQACLQSADVITRERCIENPVLELELDPSQSLKLLKPLYGFCESSDLKH